MTDRVQLFKDICLVLAEYFRADLVDIKPETCADDIEGWDSLNNVKMLIALEEKFGVRFSGMEATSLQNVDELVTLVSSKLASKQT